MTKNKFLPVFICVCFLLLAGFASHSDARVNVGININISGFTFAAPPVMAIVPGTYVYFAPDAGIDILFYGGYWYRPYQGYWFRARGYDGPWYRISRGGVPAAIIGLLPDYRHVYREYPRRSYREFNSNWRTWHRSGYWYKDKAWQAGRGHGRYQEKGKGGHGHGR
jgi:hypothetical protein